MQSFMSRINDYVLLVCFVAFGDPKHSTSSPGGNLVDGTAICKSMVNRPLAWTCSWFRCWISFSRCMLSYNHRYLNFYPGTGPLCTRHTKTTCIRAYFEIFDKQSKLYLAGGFRWRVACGLIIMDTWMSTQGQVHLCTWHATTPVPEHLFSG